MESAGRRKSQRQSNDGFVSSTNLVFSDEDSLTGEAPSRQNATASSLPSIRLILGPPPPSSEEEYFASSSESEWPTRRQSTRRQSRRAVSERSDEEQEIEEDEESSSDDLARPLLLDG
jgi:hypothetical protein